MIFLNMKVKWLFLGAVLSLAKSSSGIEKELTTTPTQRATEIYQMQVTSRVSNRFAYTSIVSKVINYAKITQETTFSMILPKRAFISAFIMEIDGVQYPAYVKEKEEAQQLYDEAVDSGQSAAIVAVSPRDSNRFIVSVNIEPKSKATFYLHYEELLIRQDDCYKLVINLHPGQPVKDLTVNVTINESRKITNLRVPPFRTGNEIENDRDDTDPRADIDYIDDASAVIAFSPNLERQKEFASILGTKIEDGIAGQFVVQYDVERDPQGGEVLVQDGYFVHFFAPTNLQPLSKHVVFVFDTSGSMSGKKIAQLRESMVKILEQLNEQDLFQLVEFNTNVKVLDIYNNNKHIEYPSYGNQYNIESVQFGLPYIANPTNIAAAKSTVLKLSYTGFTDIYSALEVGLRLVELANNKSNYHQPMIVFLTDGSPNERITTRSEIITKITQYNIPPRKSSIYTLAFGKDADTDFLQKLAAKNNGFGREIYEASDASQQLQNFYKQISSPLLANVTFKYEPSATSLTIKDFPMHFRGSELVVAGRYSKSDMIPPAVEALGPSGFLTFKPTVTRSVSSVERLWAYLTVKQLLDEQQFSDKNSAVSKRKAIDVSLEYNFVTPVTSLVVVKPDERNIVNPEPANKRRTSLVQSTTKPAATYPQYVPPMYNVPFRVHGISADSGVFAMGTNLFSSGPTFSFDTPDLFNMPTLHTDLPVTKPQKTSHAWYEVPAAGSVRNENVNKNIFSDIPWLKQILTNGVLALSKGNYKLGLYQTFKENITCNNAPNNSIGHCTLINSCKKIHFLLVSKEVYEQHFCVLKNEYAGVCCPH